MIFKHAIANALKGQNHQRRATPCDWKTDPFQALQGRHQKLFRITPFQGLNLCMCLFHRALPDANAKRLSALCTVASYLFFIPKLNISRSLMLCASGREYRNEFRKTT